MVLKPHARIAHVVVDVDVVIAATAAAAAAVVATVLNLRCLPCFHPGARL